MQQKKVLAKKVDEEETFQIIKREKLLLPMQHRLVGSLQ